MLVSNQIIKTKVNASSIEHYRKKGYNVKMNHNEELASIKDEIIYLQENNTSYAMLNIQ